MPSPAVRSPRFITLVLLAAMSTLSLNMFLPSLANIAVDFETEYAVANLAIAGYLGVTALLQLILGPLSDRFGRRPVMLGALAMFTVASLGALLATDIWVFLGFRVLQGVVVAGWALSAAVVRDTREPDAAASMIGYVTMCMAVGPLLGPMLGGVLDEVFGWRANFVAYVLGGAALFAWTWRDLTETNLQPSRTFGDQFRAYPDLATSRRFWGYAICMACSVGAFFVFLSGAPLVADRQLAMSTSMLGVGLGSITIGYAFGSFFSGRYSGRVRVSTIILSGRIAACVGLAAGLVVMTAGEVTIWTLFGSTIFVGLGNGLTTPGCGAGVVSVRPRLAGSASGLAGALVVAIGAGLTSLTGAALTGEAPAITLVAMMLALSVGGLLAILYVRWVDRREGALAAAPG
jgi:Bcr/CflA subfamily drug resistance transporter